MTESREQLACAVDRLMGEVFSIERVAASPSMERIKSAAVDVLTALGNLPADLTPRGNGAQHYNRTRSAMMTATSYGRRRLSESPSGPMTCSPNGTRGGLPKTSERIENESRHKVSAFRGACVLAAPAFRSHGMAQVIRFLRCCLSVFWRPNQPARSATLAMLHRA